MGNNLKTTVMKTLVLKFGGASVATPEHFARVAEIIMSRRSAYPSLVVVVSAMGDATNQLEELARRVNPNPPRREYDMLVSVGERVSISLLAMALACYGCEAISFTGSQSGIITCCSHSNAAIVNVKPWRLHDGLAAGKVVIVAGFQGVSTEGEITTLGRGGSDTTAVALGVALDAEHVEFYKDVAGICEHDPKLHSGVQALPQLNYSQALDIVERTGQVLHPRCLRLAEANGMPLVVKGFVNDQLPGTRIEGDPRGVPTTRHYEKEELRC